MATTDTTKTPAQVMELKDPTRESKSETTTSTDLETLNQNQKSQTTEAGTSDFKVITHNAFERELHIELLQKALADVRGYEWHIPDFNDEYIRRSHSVLLQECANQLLAKKQMRFVVDDNNRDILRFLMLYFNSSPLALDVFPERGYSLSKNILLVGEAGVGKTLLMDVFSLYLSKINSRKQYKVVSQTQMLNHYKQNNNIDLFTFNTSARGTFDGNPFSLCLNDIGLKTQKFYGNDTEVIIEEFLYARYEIWEQFGKATHLTTNLTKQEIEELFYDKHGRLADRFKMFNVIPMKGNSRR